MTDTELNERTYFQDVNGEYRTISQSLFNAAFVMKYLGEQQSRAPLSIENMDKIYPQKDL